MIDRKLILYVLIGVIAFALWDAWQKDYTPVEANPIEVVANTKEANTVSALPAGVVKTKKKGTENATPGITSKEPRKIPANRLIKVRTDVLNVAIDTLGGNIVDAELLKYPEVIHREKPVQFLSTDQDKYYTTKSGLIGDSGPDTNTKQAQYTISQKNYLLDSSKESLQVKLNWRNNQGLAVTKVFTFKKGKYDIGVDYNINNRSNTEWDGQYYAELRRKNFEPSKGLFNFSTYTGASISSSETPYEKISFSDIEKTVKKKNGFIKSTEGGWAAMQERYFLSVWIPEQDKNHKYFANLNHGIYTIGLSNDNIVVPAGGKTTIGSTLYIGPETAENISHLAKGLDRTVDYGWLWVISIGFFWILKKIYSVVGNWGWSIILITLLIKLVFYKLSESSCCSMAKMRELMPKMKSLKERYGDDKQKLHQATMELYKKEKINPMNLGGCLPMLIQIPFFIALYYVLIGAVELRHSPFIFWIQDLSAKDPYFILPLLMGASMFLQQRLSPTSADPAQAKIMMFMPVVFTFFFLNFPSGLVLYWLVNNLLSILQQWYINRKIASGSKVCKR